MCATCYRGAPAVSAAFESKPILRPHTRSAVYIIFPFGRNAIPGLLIRFAPGFALTFPPSGQALHVRGFPRGRVAVSLSRFPPLTDHHRPPPARAEGGASCSI